MEPTTSNSWSSSITPHWLSIAWRPTGPPNSHVYSTGDSSWVGVKRSSKTTQHGLTRRIGALLPGLTWRGGSSITWFMTPISQINTPYPGLSARIYHVSVITCLEGSFQGLSGNWIYLEGVTWKLSGIAKEWRNGIKALKIRKFMIKSLQVVLVIYRPSYFFCVGS